MEDKIEMEGELVITMSVPIKWFQEGNWEKYEYDYDNKTGKLTYDPHYEFDYESGIDETLGVYGSHNNHNRKYNTILDNLRKEGFKIDEIRVDADYNKYDNIKRYE